MAYNNGFPVSYAQYYPQYQPYQMPQYQQAAQQTAAPQTIQQTMTPPIVHADIIQVASETEAANYPVAAGASQMMVAKDDSAIFVKTAFANGQSSLDVFVKRPPKAPEKPVDLSVYVTREELETRLASLYGKRVKKETEAETGDGE